MNQLQISKTAENLLDLMLELNRNENMTFIFSTHDQRVIKRARRVITLEDGKILSDISDDGQSTQAVSDARMA